MRLEWTKRADAAAVEIANYISVDSPAAARMVVEEIHTQIGLLVEYPALGRPGRWPGTRELVVNRTPYIVIYRVKATSISIARILHGAQQWPPKGSKR